jgi:aminoglycoside phosphotransferase (APT) family kinase protein
MEPGRLLASGRDGDIYEFGPGLVLRKARNGRVIEGEARTIAYAREHGYPVPEIHDVRAGGTEIVMERIDGPMMMDVMLKQPWLMRRYARELADLHDRLHVIPAPAWLPTLDDDGDRLLHLDLHPMNVMLTASGPIVIDWPNAARGDALSDVAVTFVLLTCPQIPGPRALNIAVRPFRVALGRAFTSRYKGADYKRADYKGADLDEKLVLAAELKSLDKHLSAGEVAACQRLAARARARVTSR